MSNTNFWKTAYQLFKPEEPLATPEELKKFYVQRENSPVDQLETLLVMEDDPAKFLQESKLKAPESETRSTA